MRSYGMQLLDTLTREDSVEQDWSILLDHLEAAIIGEYRRTMTHTTVSDTFRRCGQLFLGGSHEAGVFTSSLFNLETRGSGVTGEIELAEEEAIRKEIERKRLRDEELNFKKYGIRGTFQKKADLEKKENEDPYGSQDTDSNSDDEEAPSGGKSTRSKGRKKGASFALEEMLTTNARRLDRALLRDKETQGELRRLALGAVLRVARWDHNALFLYRFC